MNTRRWLFAVVLACCLAGCAQPHSQTHQTPPTQLAWDDLPEQTTLRLPRGQVVQMRLIRPGQFRMGSPANEPGRDSDEGPLRVVTITQPYYIGVTEVTQAQYHAVMAENPSRFRGDTRPVDSVVWSRASSFCQRVSSLTGKDVRLPTEAQWEYACRAGSTTRFSHGDDTGRLPLFAHYRQEASAVTASRPDPNHLAGGTAPVASRRPNAWGLYDMHGNVFEWCRDWYGDRYDADDRTDPIGAPDGPYHVLRGGSFASPDWLCRSAYRHRFSADGRYNYLLGFRVVMIPHFARARP